MPELPVNVVISFCQLYHCMFN